MRPVAVIAAGLGIYMLAIPAANAAVSYKRTFLKAHGGSACYARHYSKAYLKNHPLLAFTDITILHNPESAGGNSASMFRVRLTMTAKKDNQEFAAAAVCKTADKAFNCTVDSDNSGSFRLVPASGGLRVFTKRVYLEGSTRDVEVTSKGGKERSFTLSRASIGTCTD